MDEKYGIDVGTPIILIVPCAKCRYWLPNYFETPQRYSSGRCTKLSAACQTSVTNPITITQSIYTDKDFYCAFGEKVEEVT